MYVYSGSVVSTYRRVDERSVVFDFFPLTVRSFSRRAAACTVPNVLSSFRLSPSEIVFGKSHVPHTHPSVFVLYILHLLSTSLQYLVLFFSGIVNYSNDFQSVLKLKINFVSHLRSNELSIYLFPREYSRETGIDSNLSDSLFSQKIKYA